MEYAFIADTLKLNNKLMKVISRSFHFSFDLIPMNTKEAVCVISLTNSFIIPLTMDVIFAYPSKRERIFLKHSNDLTVGEGIQ